MLLPKPRGNLQWWGYCSRGQGCSTACDSLKADSPFNSIYNQKTLVKRGDTITVKWYRHNHPGGFVRLSVGQMSQSDNHTMFDHNAVKYVCYETNCKEDYHDDILGENNGVGDSVCSTDLTIPSHLSDGPITLQWTWFGGGVYYADRQAGFANYVSCSDFLLEGGDEKCQKTIKPVFEGGDAGTSDKNMCRYWSSNNVFDCPYGAEKGQENQCGYSGMKLGAPQGF